MVIVIFSCSYFFLKVNYFKVLSIDVFLLWSNEFICIEKFSIWYGFLFILILKLFWNIELFFLKICIIIWDKYKKYILKLFYFYDYVYKNEIYMNGKYFYIIENNIFIL